MDSQQEIFCFPLLKNSKILDCMSELGFDLSEKDLLEPHKHKDRVRFIFREFVKLLLGYTDESLSTTSPEFVTSIQTISSHPELHEESSREIKLFKAVVRLMKTCGINDFGLRDWNAPTAKRLKRQLSAAINMVKFMEEKLEIYRALNSSRDELLERLAEVEKEHEILIMQRDETKQMASNRSKEIDEVEDECNALELKIKEYNKMQAANRTETGEFKKKSTVLKDKIATASLSQQAAENEINALQSKIVQSPEKIQKDLNDARDAYEKGRDDCLRMEKEMIENQKRLGFVSQCLNDIREGIKIMDDEVEVEINNYADKAKEIEKVTKTLEFKREVENEMKQKKEIIDRQIENLNQEISMNREQAEKKTKKLEEDVRAARRELMYVEEDRKEALRRVSAAEEDVEKMQENLEKEKIMLDAEIFGMINKFKEFEAIVQEKEMTLTMAALSIE